MLPVSDYLSSQLWCIILVFYLCRAQESVVEELEEQDEMHQRGKKFALILVMAKEVCLRSSNLAKQL